MEFGANGSYHGAKRKRTKESNKLLPDFIADEIKQRICDCHMKGYKCRRLLPPPKCSGRSLRQQKDFIYEY